MMDEVDIPIDYATLDNIVPGHIEQIALLGKFLVHQHSMLEKLMDALDQGNPAGVVYYAHRIKGASQMVGANELTDIYAIIEHAAKQNDLYGAQAKIHTLTAAVNRFETHLFALTENT